MTMATTLGPQLCSTSVVEDVQHDDDVTGLKLCYTHHGCFFTILISNEIPPGLRASTTCCPNASVVSDLVARFNEACICTEQDNMLADVDHRLDSIWQEAAGLVHDVAFEVIKTLGETYGYKASCGNIICAKQRNLVDYLHPQCFSLQIIADKDGLRTIPRPDLPPCRPFAAVPGIVPGSDMMAFKARDVEIVRQCKPHVLKVRTKLGTYCCKLGNADAQDSFLRELNTLRQIHKRLSSNINIPRLQGVVETEDGIVGFLTDWIETKDSNLMVLLRRTADIPNVVRQRWADCVSKTIQVLHSINVVWGDVKPSNIVIDQENNAWLIDFGGGFTRGWIDENLCNTRDGDWQGFQNTLLDIFGKR